MICCFMIFVCLFGWLVLFNSICVLPYLFYLGRMYRRTSNTVGLTDHYSYPPAVIGVLKVIPIKRRLGGFLYKASR